MTLPNKILAFDVEADGKHGLDIFSKLYTLESAAFMKVIDGKITDTFYTESKEEIGNTIQRAIDAGFTMVVYNAAYEWAVVKAQFGIEMPNVIDVMRLHQHSTKRYGKDRSLKLTKAVEEYYGVSDYKKPYLDHLIKAGVAKNEKDAHKNVSKLPSHLLKAYNEADVYYTYELLQYCVNYLDWEGYDWKADHNMYMADIKRNCSAYLRGVKFDRQLALNNLVKLQGEQKQCLDNFYIKYTEPIKQALQVISEEKTRKSFQARQAKAKNPDKIEVKAQEVTEFNLNSGLQKAALVDALNIPVAIFTDKGAYSFNKNHLYQYGDLGVDLVAIALFRKPIEELSKTIGLSEETGRIHALVRAGTTSTNRSTSGK
jgi:hypothetical protein